MRDVLLEKGLPAAPEIERLILGAALSGQSITNIVAALQESDFFEERHRRIFAAIVHLDSTGAHVDRVTAANELDTRNQLESVGGVSYLSALDEGMPQVVSLDGYLKIVRDKSILRQAIFAHQSAIQECILGADPTPEILERAERAIAALATGTRSVSFRTPREVIDRAGGLSAIVNPQQGNCIETPWRGLNRMLAGGGFMSGQMIVIGARPSIGKTALACQISDCAAVAGVGVAFFTLEMPDFAILLRIVGARAEVDTLKLTQRRATPAEVHAVNRAFGELVEDGHERLWIEDTTGCTVPVIRSALRRLAARHCIGLVVIDYLQLVETSRGHGRNRYEEVSEISRGIKRLARELKVPIVVLAQLNREIEKESRKPRPSDLRDSGSIEQDADVILMPALQAGQEEQSDTLNIDLLIAKQRNGPRARVPLVFLRRYAKFVEPGPMGEAHV